MMHRSHGAATDRVSLKWHLDGCTQHWQPLVWSGPWKIAIWMSKNCQKLGLFFFNWQKMTIFVNFFEKIRFCQFFHIQMAIFRRVRFGLLYTTLAAASLKSSLSPIAFSCQLLCTHRIAKYHMTRLDRLNCVGLCKKSCLHCALQHV